MPARNPDFEGKKMKKKMDRPKTDGRASAPKAPKKPFRLEVGKTYESEKGPLVTITHTEHSEYCARGKGVWMTNGSIWLAGSRTEGKYGCLIREVPGAKRPRSRKAKGSQK